MLTLTAKGVIYCQDNLGLIDCGKTKLSKRINDYLVELFKEPKGEYIYQSTIFEKCKLIDGCNTNTFKVLTEQEFIANYFISERKDIQFNQMNTLVKYE